MPHEVAQKLAAKYFGAWQAPAIAFDPGLAPVYKSEQKYYFERRDIKQTLLSLNYYATTLEDIGKLAAWEIISNYLTLGTTSILNQEVRVKRGLAYSIDSFIDAHKDAGIFSVTTSTQKPREAIQVIEQTIANIPDGLTEEVFERVRVQTIGSFMRYIVKPENQSFELGGNFISYDRLFPPEEWLGYLRSVRREDAISLAQQHLKSDNSVLTMIGPDDIGR